MDMSRAVVKARNTLGPFGGDEITEAIILLDRWLMRLPDTTKRELLVYYGSDDLPTSAKPSTEPSA